jgi:molybdopterin molybdotransferase
MPEVSVPATLLSFEEARHTVEQQAANVHPGSLEFVPLPESLGRVLAKPVTADRDYPPFRRAMRDGYALHAADLSALPAILEVVGEIKAGADPKDILPRLTRGQAVAIMTGAAAPDGADAVVMVEYTSLDGNRVSISHAVHEGDNIVPVGSEARARDVLLEPGTLLDFSALAVAASVGQENVWLYRRPVVGILSTGDEIVELDVRPGPTQIRNSNTYSLAAQVQQAGGEPRILGIARDNPDHLRELITEGLDADLLLLTGGVSMGKYDLVEQVLADFEAEFFFTGARIQPGKPIVFGRAKNKPFFGLPGNPVSTMVTFALFVQPMLEALSGQNPQPLRFLHARLKTEIKIKTGLTRFLPGMLTGQFDQAEVELARWHGSGDIASTAKANCYVVLPPDREQIPAGEWIAVMKK